jgi:hypothetical protein
MFKCLLIVALILRAAMLPAAADAPALPDCNAPPQTVQPSQHLAVVDLNQSTTWQPRAGEIILRIDADRNMLEAVALRACLRWGTGQLADPASKRPFDMEAPVHIRPYDVDGAVNLGVVVPALAPPPESFLTRVLPQGTLRSDGFGLVPVADLRLIAVGRMGVLADVVFPVGITKPWRALLFSLVLLTATLWTLHALAATRGASGAGLLKLICSRDRMASLSAFQLLVTSVTVAFSAVYVMALSGNLINLTPGTLVMLGVAGASGVAAALQPPQVSADSARLLAERARQSADLATEGLQQLVAAAATGDAEAKAQAERARTLAESAAREAAAMQVAAVQAHARITGPPRWSDLIGPVDGSGGIDMTRVQMLFFTLVTAAFVLLKVLNTYIVPDIPDYYLALIGISNGVYVAARAGNVQRGAAAGKEA